MRVSRDEVSREVKVGFLTGGAGLASPFEGAVPLMGCAAGGRVNFPSCEFIDADDAVTAGEFSKPADGSALGE